MPICRILSLTLVLLALFFGGADSVLAASAPPVITSHPSGMTVTVGQPATFTVTATSSTIMRYQWKKNGIKITGATAASYTTPPTTLADNGAAFTVVVKNRVGRVTSTAAILGVNVAPTPTPTPTPAPPVITRQPRNKTATEGQTAAFSVSATGTGTLSYQWRKNGIDIAGATASTYTTPATVLADNGSKFAVTVSDIGGSVSSAEKTLTVTAAPTVPQVVTETFMTNVDGSRLAWDIYLPSGPAPQGGWPAVLVIHGGGFHGGGPASCVQAATDLAASGYVALAVTYRLAPGQDGISHQLIDGQPDEYLGRKTGTFPDQTDDVANAVRFARNPPSTSAIYGLVNGQVGAVGSSAGGSHAAWVATHGSLDDDRADVAVSLSGAYDASDFDDAWNPLFKANMLSYVNAPETDLEAFKAASPAWSDLAGTSPLFMVASFGDSMPPRQIPDMVAQLDAAGITNYQQLFIAGDLHGFDYWEQIDVDGLAIKTKTISFLASVFTAAQ